MGTAEAFRDAAKVLIDHGNHAGHWRRAISSAYYAAFHELVDVAAAMVFQGALRRPGRSWFEHSALKKVAHAVSSAPANSESDEKKNKWLDQHRKLELTSLPPGEIRDLCRLLLELLNDRQRADYFSDDQEFTKTDAQKALSDAERVSELIRDCRRRPYFRLLCFAMFRHSIKTPRR